MVVNMRAARVKDLEKHLSALLAEIKVNDENYAFRYSLVLQALLIARTLGLDCGIGIDRDSDVRMDGFRVVVYIVLPTGQVSWHMPEWGGTYDGHTTPRKYTRIDAFVRMMELDEEWKWVGDER